MVTITEIEMCPPNRPSNRIELARSFKPVSSLDLEVLSPVGTTSTTCPKSINLFYVSAVVYVLMTIGIIVGVIYITTDIFD